MKKSDVDKIIRENIENIYEFALSKEFYIEVKFYNLKYIFKNKNNLALFEKSGHYIYRRHKILRKLFTATLGEDK